MTYEKAVDPASAALVDVDAGPVTCNACSPTCFRAVDPLQPLAGGLPSNVTDQLVELTPGGGLTLSLVDGGVAGSIVDAGTITRQSCTLGVAPDVDCDGIVDAFDPYPNAPPFATSVPALLIDVEPGQTGVGELALDFLVNVADIYLLVDTSASMGSELSRLRHDFVTGTFVSDPTADCADYDFDYVPNNELKSQGFIGAIRCRLRDSYFGLGLFVEAPLPGSGNPDSVPYLHMQDLTLDLPSIVAALDEDHLAGNHDWAESQALALNSIVTGNGMYFGIDRRSVPPRIDCPAGTWGYPCFRSKALPIVIHVSDAPMHQGPNNGYLYPTDIHLSTGTTPSLLPVPATNEDFTTAHDAGDVTNSLVTFWGNTNQMTTDVPDNLIPCGKDQAPATFNRPPTFATACATERQVCSIPAGVQARVWFGTREGWSWKDGMTGDVMCDVAEFGDPAPSLIKECRYQIADLTGGQVYCAGEGQQCVLPADTVATVWYGASGSFVAISQATGAVDCNNLTFGDPFRGTVKQCFYQSQTPTGAPVRCASLGQTCTLPSGHSDTVWFGTVDHWNSIAGVSGSVSCDVATFGDPAPLAADKTCYYGASPPAGRRTADAVFRFSLSSTRSVTLSSDGSGFDSRISIFAGSPSSPTLLVCDHDSGSVVGGSRLTTSLNAGTYYAVVKGRTSVDAGPYELTIGGAAPADAVYVAPTWAEIGSNVLASGAKVISVLTCGDLSDPECANANTQAQALANLTGAVDALSQPLVFVLGGDGVGLSTTIVDSITSLVDGLTMNIRAVVSFAPDANPGFNVSIAAVDSPGDGCSGLAGGVEHLGCAPGATPHFTISFENPAGAPVPPNPADPNGGYNFRAQLIGDGTNIVDEIPIYVVPADVVTSNNPAPTYAASGTYWQDLGSDGCTGTQSPDWRELYWNADVPPGTSIRFRACASDTQAGLGACSPVQVAELSNVGSCAVNSDCAEGFCDLLHNSCQVARSGTCATDADCPANASCVGSRCSYNSQPVEIGTRLRSDNLRSFLRMQVELTGSPPYSSSPALNSWELRYYCTNAN